MENQKQNPALDKSYLFSLRIIKLYRYLCENKKEYVLSKQLVRSGTSIGANVEEAVGAQSRKKNLGRRCPLPIRNVVKHITGCGCSEILNTSPHSRQNQSLRIAMSFVESSAASFAHH